MAAEKYEFQARMEVLARRYTTTPQEPWSAERDERVQRERSIIHS